MRIVIAVNRQLDGVTYRLDPKSRVELINAKLSDTIPASSLFVSYSDKDGIEASFGPMWRNVMELLTGLGADHLPPDSTVDFIDSKNNQVLFSTQDQDVKVG